MCKFLKINRANVYYKKKIKSRDSALENEIIKSFNNSRNNYGTRKIKIDLFNIGYIVSRRKIGKIMKKYGLVSNYTVKQFKITKSRCNEEKINNIVDRNFNREEVLEVVVSDLTYVPILGNWNYICIIMDLFNREIVGYAVGKKKDANLVHRAFSKIKTSLEKICIFHTDRGNEFKNEIIDELLNTFSITRSLSKKGCPYDNAVAEAAFKVIKTEFIHNTTFNSLEELEIKLFDYVNWYNSRRVHGSLGYLTPIEYKKIVRKKVV
jgi:putative transposase